MREIVQKISSFLARPWRQTVFVSALFLLLTLLFTFPLALRLTTHIPGYSGDINYYYWSNWWFGEAMARGTNPWWTDMLWNPNGTSLVFSTNRFVSGFLGWLIEPLTGQIAAYNIILLLSLLASALGVFLFVRELTGNGIAAFTAAFVFTFNPWRFHKLQCHHFLMSTWFFGFALWMLLRVIQRKDKKIKHGILLGIFGAITLYESLFLFDLLFLGLAVVVLVFALFDRGRFWQQTTLKGLLAAGLTFVVLAIPMFVMITVALPEYGSLPYAPGSEKYSTDLLNLIWPSPMPWSEFGSHPVSLLSENNHHYRGPDENFSPLGWVLIPLTLIGWWVGRRRHKVFADVSIIAMLFFTMLSLGPKLHIAGSNTGIPLPYSILSWLPPFGLVRAPSRFIIVAFLFAGILAAMAIAQIIRKTSSWKYGRLVPFILIVLLVLDYMPHGSATHDQRDYPATIDALAAVEGDFAVLPYGYQYIDTMRFAPIHGKPVTAGYVARNTLFARPVQDTTARLVYALLNASRKSPESERVKKMTETVRTFLRSINIGAILHQGNESRLTLLATLVDGRVLAREGDHGLILLNKRDSSPASLTLNAETWPPMPRANLSGGVLADQLWTGFNGFRLAIPSTLMPEETIELTVSSAVRHLENRRHFMLVNVNSDLIARIELSPTSATYTVTFPENIRRLPMNIIAVTQEFGPAQEKSPIPFAINALSGNLPAGNHSALYVGSREILPDENRSASFILATVDKKGFAKTIGEFPIHKGNFAAAFGSAVHAAVARPWIVLMGCGEISPSAAELAITLFNDAGFELDRRDLRAHSFVAVLNSKSREAVVRSSREGYIHLVNGPIHDPAAPTLNIDEIKFH